jgi:hypothetical protein
MTAEEKNQVGSGCAAPNSLRDFPTLRCLYFSGRAPELFGHRERQRCDVFLNAYICHAPSPSTPFAPRGGEGKGLRGTHPTI